MCNFYGITKKAITGMFSFFLVQNFCSAQNSISISSLSSFQNPSPSWHVASEVKADLAVGKLVWKDGAGILVNMPDAKTKGADLFTSFEHGDADVELDYMMAKGSNSGIYLQGRYEIQLMDSWGTASATSADNGGVYQRWDDNKPEGQKGYQGYAPRQSVSRAPGLWQHLKISFQAPRFNAAGQKTENAKLLRVELNGVVIHEDLELLGPTRGASGEEKPTGPLRIQGDHGAVAIRNLVVNHYNNAQPELKGIKYSVYETTLDREPDYKTLKTSSEGAIPVLTGNISNKLENNYLVRYTGTLSVKEAGDYNFNLNMPGSGMLKVNNATVIPISQWRGRAKQTLPKGDVPFELLYAKTEDWAKPSIALSISGPGVREFSISDINSSQAEVVDPILVNASSNTILRSFMDLPDAPRVTHAVSVGTPEGVHYTYDMDNGSIVQAWRGEFLNATPMWHERGDGSSRPSGSVIYFGKPALSIAKLSSQTEAWPTDTVASGFRTRGYSLDEQDRPAFRYQVYGTMINDASVLTTGNQGITRTITAQQPTANLYHKIATAKNITEQSNGLYLVDDGAYYVRLEETGGAKATVRDSNGKKELVVPVQSNLKYSILF